MCGPNSTAAGNDSNEPTINYAHRDCDDKKKLKRIIILTTTHTLQENKNYVITLYYRR